MTGPIRIIKAPAALTCLDHRTITPRTLLAVRHEWLPTQVMVLWSKWVFPSRPIRYRLHAVCAAGYHSW